MGKGADGTHFQAKALQDVLKNFAYFAQVLCWQLVMFILHLPIFPVLSIPCNRQNLRNAKMF